MNCSFHDDRIAVRFCPKCGKPLCAECADEHEGLCLDCYKELQRKKRGKLPREKSNIFASQGEHTDLTEENIDEIFNFLFDEGEEVHTESAEPVANRTDIEHRSGAEGLLKVQNKPIAERPAAKISAENSPGTVQNTSRSGKRGKPPKWAVILAVCRIVYFTAVAYSIGHAEDQPLIEGSTYGSRQDSTENSSVSIPEEILEADRQDTLDEAYNTAQNSTESSEESIRSHLTEVYGEEIAEYAMNRAVIDFNANALNNAENYCEYTNYSEKEVRDHLRSSKFTDENIEYAMANLDIDWQESANRRARRIVNWSYEDKKKSEVYLELLEYGYTEEQAKTAVLNLG